MQLRIRQPRGRTLRSYVLDNDGSPYTEAPLTERLLWLLCSETRQVTVRPTARLSKRVAPT